MDITELSALGLARRISSGELAVAEALDATFAAIDEKNKKYNCFITLCRERAYERARAVQAEIDAGMLLSPLAGVPIGVKDNICVEGVRMTCGSRMLENYVSPYSACAVEKLERAGLIVVGTLNMDEFAMGSSTETSYFGAALNPCDTARVPGGSSGGAAAALASGMIPLALGSDTGGSVRQPASFCGVTGFKPTYGAVSRRGLTAYASSFDQIGPMARCADDCAAVMGIISGRDSGDPTSADSKPVSFDAVSKYSLEGRTVGVPEEFFDGALNKDVRSAVLSALERLRKLGARVESFSLPMLKYAVPAYYIIACAQASSNLSRYDGLRYGRRAEAGDLADTYIKSRTEGFGAEVKRRIMLGNFVLSAGYYEAYYNKALKVRGLIHSAMLNAFDKYDFIAGPVYPTAAPKLGELDDPLKAYLGDEYTVIANLAGLPAVSVPCGAGEEFLPVGLQLMARPFADEELLGAAKLAQEACRDEI